MKFFTNAFSLPILLSGLAAAIPDNVTVELLSGGCAAYPGYDASTSMAGPWIVQAQETGRIDGKGDISTFSRGQSGIRWGIIVIADQLDVAKRPLRCVNDGVLQAYVPTGVSATTWEDINLDPYPYERVPIYFVDGPAIEPYAHYVDGERLDGVYLGSANETTWGFKYYESSEFGNYYQFRLLGPGTEDPVTGEALLEGEFTGWVKVAA